MRIAVLGGTGGMGSVLAKRLAERNEVMIGSRSLEKATVAAARVPGVKGQKGEDAARWCEVAVVSFPFDAIGALGSYREPLAGKLVMSTIVPLKISAGTSRYGTEGKSAAEMVAETLPESRVATAFNNVPVSFFKKPIEHEVDVLVATETRETFEEASKVVKTIPGMRPLYVGPLSQAESVERVTVLAWNATKLNGGPWLAVRFVS